MLLHIRIKKWALLGAIAYEMHIILHVKSGKIHAKL